jgi:molybdopterin/thiamine biosynthesis adenylyltransferase
VTIETHAVRLTTENAADLIAGSDVVLDGTDSFVTRLAVADAAYGARIPLVSAAVGQFEGQVAVFRGWETDKPCYRCFVGSDPDRAEASCADQGVLGAVTGVLGSLGATEVLRALLSFGEDSAGSVLLVDLLAFRFRTLRLTKDPGCPGCAVHR